MPAGVRVFGQAIESPPLEPAVAVPAPVGKEVLEPAASPHRLRGLLLVTTTELGEKRMGFLLAEAGAGDHDRPPGRARLATVTRGRPPPLTCLSSSARARSSEGRISAGSVFRCRRLPIMYSTVPAPVAIASVTARIAALVSSSSC